MTIKECIDLVDAQKPNQYSISEKVMWLTFLDKIIINEVLKTHEGYDGRYDDFVGYSEDDLTASLIVESPYDQLYPAYLKMKIDGENGEQTRYNNSAASYNAYMLEFRKNYNKTHMPLGNGAKRNGGVSVKVDVNLSEAEYEAIRRDVYNALSRDVNEITSPDKLYDIVMRYVQSNAERFKGAKGDTPKKGEDYFTEEEVSQIKKEVMGDDGYSPTVEITSRSGGTTIRITDKNGTKSFDILNGADGKSVTRVDQLDDAEEYLKKQGGRASVDYGEEGIDVNVNAQRSVTLGAEHVNILGSYEATFKAIQGDVAADFSNQRVTKLAAPKSDTDAVNKKYVDDLTKSIYPKENVSELKNDAGYITRADVPTRLSQFTNDQGYVDKVYVDDAVKNSGGGGGGGGTSGNVPTKLSDLEADRITRTDLNPFSFTAYIAEFGGHEMNFGFDNITFKKKDYGLGIDFDGQTLHNVGTPEADTDGANKKYVDDAVKDIDIPDVSVPTKVSQLENDADYLQNNTDMVITGPHTLEMSSEVVKIEGFYGGSIEIDTEGNVNIAGDAKVQNPVSDTSVANKGYVDNAVNGIPSWAKQPTKPTYTAEEVGAVAKNQGSANVGKILVVGTDGNLVLADMPVTGDVIGYIDENNNIIVQGDLSDGTYSVKYEMEDGTKVDIGNLVIDSNVYYSVTNNLTNCTSNNGATQVVEGESYSATITANSGYELKSVSVTMGGSAVSVSGGVINIAIVTGDIVITAVAEEATVTPSYTNIIPTLTDIDLTTIYNDIGYKENTRISLSKISTSNPTGEKTETGTTLLGIMPLGNDGDVLHLRGALLIDRETSSYSGLIWYYDASGTLLNTATIGINLMKELIGTDTNGDTTFTLTHNKIRLIDGAAYIRLNIANPTGELIMTRNQLIPKD